MDRHVEKSVPKRVAKKKTMKEVEICESMRSFKQGQKDES